MNILLAQGHTGKLPIPQPEKFSLGLPWVFAAIGVVVLLVVIWVVFFRRSPEELSGWGPSHSHYKATAGQPDEQQGHGKRRRRRRRREHRPRNPTLAETGGLPPVRTTSSSSDSGD